MYITQVPSGSSISDEDDNITKVYSESGELLLTKIREYEIEHRLMPEVSSLEEPNTYFPTDIEIKAGKMGFVDVTIKMHGDREGNYRYHIDNVFYNVSMVSGIGDESMLPMPEGFDVSMEVGHFEYGPGPRGYRHVSTITIKTTMELTPGDYFLLLEQDIENVYQGKGWITVKVEP